MAVRSFDAQGSPEAQLRFFIESVVPKDPLGSGKQSRFIRVEAAGQLTHPDVEALIAAAIDQASEALPSKARAKTRGKLVIRTISSERPLRRKWQK